MLARSSRRVGEGHPGWIIAIPWSVVAGERPEVAFLHLTSAGVEYRGRGLVHEQLGGIAQIVEQAIVNRGQLIGRFANPRGQSRAIQVDPLTAVNLGLPIERQVVRVFADDDTGHGGLGRYAAFD